MKESHYGYIFERGDSEGSSVIMGWVLATDAASAVSKASQWDSNPDVLFLEVSGVPLKDLGHAVVHIYETPKGFIRDDVAGGEGVVGACRYCATFPLVALFPAEVLMAVSGELFARRH